MSDPIRTGLADGVLTVTLARAEKKNAITQAMYSALAEATRRALAALGHGVVATPGAAT